MLSLRRLSGVAFWLAVTPLVSFQTTGGEKEVTILYTNDFHSAIDPIPAYWMEGAPRLGGAAELCGLVDEIRGREGPVFLFDTGDMFTGMLSFLTRGEAMMEMMASCGYDAMAIGNHEFDYGADNFEKQMNRVSFPVLGANIFYKGTRHPYSRPCTILERDGVRIGVIGVIGQDARSVALPSGVTNLDFLDPIPVVRQAVQQLRPSVDLIVVLAHQGKTGPMQTDAEAHPDLQRDFDADIELCGAVAGIDVFVGGHAHRGIETPYVHPETGTIIVQTYGYGTRLGYLKLKMRDGQVVGHQGELLKVWSDQIEPNKAVAAKMDLYRRRVDAEIGEELARSEVRLVRDYRAESPLGDFVTDVMRQHAKTEIALTNAGGLRADLPQGAVTKGNVLDALPFENSVVSMKMTGAQIREVVEQGLTLERGMIQVSGLRVVYDLSRPAGDRALEIVAGSERLDPQRLYLVATNSFLAQGGDLYETFTKVPDHQDSDRLLSSVVMDFLRRTGRVTAPTGGRLLPKTPQGAR